MKLINTELSLSTKGDSDIHDISERVQAKLDESGIVNGYVLLFVPGSTAALTTIEYERGLIEDLKNGFQSLVPENMPYRHNERWGDGNGHSHVRAALLGPSLIVPVCEGKLALGTWQQIVFIDFDNRARRRRLVVQIAGAES